MGDIHLAPPIPCHASVFICGGSPYHKSTVLGVYQCHPEVSSAAVEPRSCSPLRTWGQKCGEHPGVPQTSLVIATPFSTEVGLGTGGVLESHAALVDVTLTVPIPWGPH